MTWFRTRHVPHRQRWPVSRSSIGTVVPVALSCKPSAAKHPPGEFAAITTNCFGAGPTPGSLAPLIDVNLYNLHSGVSPAVSPMITAGTTTSPLKLVTSPSDLLLRRAPTTSRAQ